MIIGFTGPSCVGKTTAAKALAEKLGYGFVPSNASQIAKEMGYNPNSKTNTVTQFIDFYVNMVNTYSGDVLNAYRSNSNVVFDRSPIDILIYFRLQLETICLSNSRGLIPCNQNDATDGLTVLCALEALLNLFDHIFTIMPNMETIDEVYPLEEKHGRSDSDGRKAFIERMVENIPSSMEGVEESRITIIPNNKQREDRVSFCAGVVTAIVKNKEVSGNKDE